jgi:hypothetical protein
MYISLPPLSQDVEHRSLTGGANLSEINPLSFKNGDGKKFKKQTLY